VRWSGGRVAGSLGALAFLLVSCRSAHVSGPAVAPLQTAATLDSLFARADSFPGARSIARVRVTTDGETRSFRAQLIVESRQRMQLIAYTPVGTTAATITADGDHVTVVDAIHGLTTEGTATEMLAPYGFFTGGLSPAEMGMLLLGYPPRRDLKYETAATGLSRATAGDIDVTFDPPSFPARHVVVAHGSDRVEVDHLEVASMN
jgi:hypothetical protein